MQPKIIGKRYILQDMLGQGGMGTVYRAEDRLTGQTVALKQVLATAEVIDLSTSYNVEDFRLGLAREFKLLASLRHPHIIEVIDYGFDDEQQPYFTMELLENAQTVLDASRDLSVEQRVTLIVQMLQALDYLHRREILHRDLKPANVLVVDNQIKMLDFGLSVMRDHVAQDEAEDTTAGTLTYMAPEILMGHSATERSDLYAVGMMAYELLAGFHPFKDMDAATLINSILYTIPDIEKIDVKIEVAQVVGKLLHKDPADRYMTAREVIHDLSEAIGQTIAVETVEIRESFLQAARLVGRQEELNTLTDALDVAGEGKGSAWLIAGESGVGKSRLVDELRTLSLVSGALVMRGQAVSEGGSPYQLWHLVLRWMTLLMDLAPKDRDMLRLFIPQLGETPPEASMEPNKVQGRLLELLREMFKRQERPVVILLEDLHWAGMESLSLLAQFNAFVADLPLLLVASYRDDERPDLPEQLPAIPVLKLNRLDSADIAKLSQAMLGDVGAQPQVVDLLQRETEGNVFFLIEVVRALADEAGDLNQIGKMTLPQHVFAGGVQLIIQRRLQQLPQWAHHFVSVAAVAGRQQDVALLHELNTEGIDVNQWLVECVNASVLEVFDGEWRFAHDKLRDAVIAELSDDERQALHRRVAQAIERVYDEVERASPLAYHWSRAGEPEKEEYYVVLSGEQALRSGAYREALQAFQRATALLENAPNRSSLDVQKREIKVRNRHAEAHLGIGSYEEARQIFRTSLLISEQIDDQPSIAKTLYALGEVAYALNMNSKSREYFQEGLRIFRKLDDKSAIANTLNNLGNIAYDQGDEIIAKQLFQQSLTLSREITGQKGVNGHLNMSFDVQEQYQEDRERMTAEVEILLESEQQSEAADKLFNLGKTALESNTFDEAQQHFQRCLMIYRDNADEEGMIRTYNQLGLVSIHTGDFITATKNLRRALQKATENDLILQVLHTLMNIARLRIAEDRKEYALELLAFIYYHPSNFDEIEDEAERMVFELESELPPSVVEAIWERGKTSVLDDIVQQTLSLS